MKITWAIDIFGTSKSDASKIGKFLKLFISKPADISVAYVSSPQEPRLSTAFDVPESDRFSKYPLRLLKTVVAKSGLSVAPKGHILATCKTLSLTKAADDLLSAVKDAKPDLIAVQTMQRKGLQRALLGSFSETLIHRSRVSLLVTNPWHKLPTRIKNILFADDFSPATAKARGFVASLAAQLGAGVTVVHTDYLYGYGRKNHVPGIEEYRKTIDKQLAISMETFAKAAVDVEARVDHSDKGAAEAILTSAKNGHADLIVVAAKTGPVLALLGGSVTRKVVRESQVPVLVFKS